MSQSGSPPAIIDVHAHCFPQELIAFLRRFDMDLMPAALVPPTSPVTDSDDQIARRLEMMDSAGVAMQILSPPPIQAFEDKADTVKAARIVNDSYARLIERHPERLAAFVTLPLPFVEESLQEMERGLDQLDMAGVTMLCFAANRSVTEPEFEPLYQEMDRRGSVLFFHPSVNGLCSRLINDYGFAPSVGTSMEDTTLVLHMMAAHIPHRYPNIKMIVPHLGGLLPMLMQRLDNQVPAAHRNLPERPSETVKRFWYDTVTHGSAAALRCACEAFGADRILPGSDYPALEYFEAYTATFGYIRDAGLAAEDVDKILNRNARGLFCQAISPQRAR